MAFDEGEESVDITIRILWLNHNACFHHVDWQEIRADQSTDLSEGHPLSLVRILALKVRRVLDFHRIERLFREEIDAVANFYGQVISIGPKHHLRS